MTSAHESDVRRALAACAAGTASNDRVMRALVGHDGWFVPSAYASDALGLGVFDRTILLGAISDPPPQELSIFTDVESVLAAFGQPLGPYVGAVSGALAFAALDDAYTALRVNPASPREEQWHTDRAGFAIARLWADAVSLERALPPIGGRELPRQRLGAYAGYTILVGAADRSPVIAPLGENVGHAAIAFTAPDRAAAFIAHLPEDQRAAVVGATIDGATMFGHLEPTSVAGLLLNNDDPASSLLIPHAEFEAIRKRQR